MLEKRWPRMLPAGVIHADLFPDNVFFEGERLSGLIDFYFACIDSLAYDLAVCLNAWCFEIDGSFGVTKARRLIAAITPSGRCHGKNWMPCRCSARGAAMRFLGNPSLRLAAHAEECTGNAEEPDGVRPEVAVSSRRSWPGRLRLGRYRWAVKEARRKAPCTRSPTVPASGTPVPAVGARCCVGGLMALSGGEPLTTNNRMELTAAIAALDALKRPSRCVCTRTRSTCATALRAGRLAGSRTAGAPLPYNRQERRPLEAPATLSSGTGWSGIGYVVMPAGERASRQTRKTSCPGGPRRSRLVPRGRGSPIPRAERLSAYHRPITLQGRL